jgi:hypothetical protein
MMGIFAAHRDWVPEASKSDAHLANVQVQHGVPHRLVRMCD